MNDEQKKEQQRVDLVITEIKAQQILVDDQLNKAHQETRAVEGNYTDNASINTFEIDDASETNAEVQQQRQLVARVVETENILKKQGATLKALAQAPYFGKVDITEAAQPMSLYIGLASFQDKQQHFLVYDWRAPIAAIYYNGTLGQVTYTTPSGARTVQLTNKRQFTIENGQITNMFDTDETVGDEMLQYALGQQSDAYMQNIVATIQKEQNDIIRDTKHDVLLVQGVAGSGKTSAILQRIAYLLYHARRELTADQIVLFSPNRLFSHYIADVLPSLGERNMRQITLAEFLDARLEGLNVQSLFNEYEINQIRHVPTALNQAMESVKLVTNLDAYVAQLAPTDLKFADIYHVDQVIFSAYHSRIIFNRLSPKLSIGERLLQTKNTLIKELKRKLAHLAESAIVAKEVNQLTVDEYQALLGSQSAFHDLARQQAYAQKQYVYKKYQPIYDAIYNNYFIDIFKQYAAFLQYYGTQIGQNAMLAAKEETFLTELEYHRIDLQDAVPLLLLRDMLTKNGQNREIKHLFIDEMQDYSLVQLAYLKHAFPNAKLTILGDTQQALFRTSTNLHFLAANLKTLFKTNNLATIVLNKSYRSTQEITNFGKALLEKGAAITAFTRHGELPILLRTGSRGCLPVLLELLQQPTQQKTTAIITKTQQQAAMVSHQLTNAKLANNLMTATDRELKADLVVLPIYLAKGLEFDRVIAYDVSAENYAKPTDAAIIYTIASRAMHELVLIADGPVNQQLAQIDPSLYRKLIVNK
ncbi:RNA polymerase recycling motor HelD [Periweissella beninensis]|uniref:RNA polymerase recycling motor HelD n=1 Tax=Periweissella beninensis TaxID=504936 RepID=UPI0021A71B68|nr:RNA polymerase recycling motor HelD [Periweissella beninensis]MCT4396183.1 ATP-dependent DNA helicase [Periweissella beninensis]